MVRKCGASLQVGDIFCTPLPLGYWGAVRVFEKSVDGSGALSWFVYCTKYCGKQRPTLDDRRLLMVARAVGQVDGSRHVVVGTADGFPGRPFELVGNVPIRKSETKFQARRIYLAWDMAFAGVSEWLYIDDRAEYARFDAALDALIQEEDRDRRRSRWSPRSRSARALPEKVFWDMIGASNPLDEVETLVGMLSKQSDSAIIEFGEWLAYKLYLIDGQKYAANAGIAGQSDDAFLYARCYVVASGQAMYDRVRRSANRFPANVDCEDILYVVARAYKMKTGAELDHKFAFGCETGSNGRSWA